jgi:hypothetical protein
MLSGACLLHDPSDRVNPPSELIDRAISDPSQSITSPVTELDRHCRAGAAAAWAAAQHLLLLLLPCGIVSLASRSPVTGWQCRAALAPAASAPPAGEEAYLLRVMPLRLDLRHWQHSLIHLMYLPVSRYAVITVSVAVTL